MFTKREKARTNNVLGGQHLCSLLKNKEYMCTYQRQGFLLSPSAQQTEVCSFVIQICLCSLGLWGRGEWLGDSVPPFQFSSVQFCSVAQSCPTLCDESQHARPPCPSQTPGVHSDSYPSSWWCHPAISSSVVPFSSCSQSLPASGSFLMSQLFTWGGRSIGVTALASVLPKKSQG